MPFGRSRLNRTRDALDMYTRHGIVEPGVDVAVGQGGGSELHVSELESHPSPLVSTTGQNCSRIAQELLPH